MFTLTNKQGVMIFLHHFHQAGCNLGAVSPAIIFTQFSKLQSSTVQLFPQGVFIGDSFGQTTV